MRFAIFDHEGKGAYLRQLLTEHGHTPADDLQETDLLLADCDWPWAHPRPQLIQAASDAGAKIVLYPHGGQPTMFVYDGLAQPDPLVDLRLEHGQGSIDIAFELGLDLNQQTAGWLYCPSRPFQPIDEPKRILFAPQHPNIEALNTGRNGHDPSPTLNQHVYRQFLKLGHQITVSIVGPAWRNGLWPHPRATFVANHQMLFPVSYQMIADADAVVAAGTIGAAGVALGKPTVMIGSGDCTDYIDGAYQVADHADTYQEQLRYPLDAADADLDVLLERACTGDPAAAEWRERFVGDTDTDALVGLLEELVPEPAERSVAIEGVTARATGLGG